MTAGEVTVLGVVIERIARSQDEPEVGERPAAVLGNRGADARRGEEGILVHSPRFVLIPGEDRARRINPGSFEPYGLVLQVREADLVGLPFLAGRARVTHLRGGTVRGEDDQSAAVPDDRRVAISRRR